MTTTTQTVACSPSEWC